MTNTMRSISIILILVLAQPGFALGRKKVKWMGGTAQVKPNKEGRVGFMEDGVVFDFKKHGSVIIPYQEVTIIEYGQRAGRRVGQTIALALAIGPFALPLLLTKRRRHYLSVAWVGSDEVTHAAVVELGKGVNRSVIQSMSLASGVEIEFQDEKAREHYGR